MSEHVNNARLQLFYRLYEQVDNAKDRAIILYNTEADRLGLEWNHRKWFHGHIVGVDYNGVDVKWDEYRRNCHVDGGQFQLFWEALADDTSQQYITALVEKQVAAQLAELTARVADALERKRQKLAELKRELGEV